MKRSRAACGVSTVLAVLAVLALSTASACGGDGTAPGPGGSTGDGGGIASGAVAPFGDVHDGVATYYDATGAGACSFDPTPGDLDVAAMNAPEFAGSAVCGECVAVTGPRGSVTVRIVDLCPECEAGHLDLSAEAFAKVANPVDGRVAIRWQATPCAVTGNVAYHFKDGSNPYWTALQVRNHRLPIAKLEIEKSGAFVEVARASYNYFVDPAGTGSGAVHVRITAIDGQTLDDTLPPVASDVTVVGAAQLR
jgi:expansin (peptidoglycan-binding protein)